MRGRATQPVDLGKIAFLTRRFRHLQGLRLAVPQALLLAAISLPHARILPVTSAVLLDSTLLIAYLALSRYGAKYYAARLGVVLPHRSPLDGIPQAAVAGVPSRRQGAEGAGSLQIDVGALAAMAIQVGGFSLSILAFGFLLAFFYLDLAPRYDPAVLAATKAFYLLGATAFLGDWCLSRERRLDQIHVALLGLGILAMAAFSGQLHLFDARTPHVDFCSAVLILSAAVAIRGTCDHLQLLRAFPLSPDDGAAGGARSAASSSKS